MRVAAKADRTVVSLGVLWVDWMADWMAAMKVGKMAGPWVEYLVDTLAEMKVVLKAATKAAQMVVSKAEMKAGMWVAL
jgi:hypothetical protein